MKSSECPALLILNQVAGSLVWEFAEDFAVTAGPVALLTGHDATLTKAREKGIVVFPAVRYSRGSYPRRVISWLTFWIQALIWIWRWPKTIPILFFTNPPILPWLGPLLRMIRGQQYAIMILDVYPDVLMKLWKMANSNPVVRLWNWVNARAYAHSTLVMTLSDDMRKTLESNFAATRTFRSPIEVIFPWTDTTRIRPVPKQENWFAQKFAPSATLTVMYSGNMGMSHDIETLLLVAEQMKQDSTIQFLFVGSGPKWKLVDRAKSEKHLPNITLLPWQPEDVLPYSLASADVAFVSLQEELAGVSFPAKAFSFLAAGAPLIVSCAERSDLAEIVSRFSCGWKVRPKDAPALLRLLESIRDNPSVLEPARRASRRAAEQIGSRQNSRMMVDLVSKTFHMANPPGVSIPARSSSPSN